MLLSALMLAVTVDRAVLDQHVGLYTLDDKTFVITPYLDDENSLVFVRYPSGRLGKLRQTSPSTFTGGPTIGADSPIEVRARFDGDSLHWSEQGGDRRGSRLQLRRQEVRIQSGPLRLAGTLWLPSTRGTHPAVVLLHGGGPQTRSFLWVEYFFLRHGVAVLAYDKRGVGGSTGDWALSTTTDLAGDALAAVDFLRSRPEIDANHIGLYGSSNGGWVAPIAAAKAPERIAFVIARSASGLPERENIIYEIETDLRSNGYGDDVVTRTQELHRKEIELVRTGGRGWNDFRDDLRSAANEPWFSLVRLPRVILEWNENNLKNIDSWIAQQRRDRVDPAEVWARVKCPVLVQLGTSDGYVPAERSAKIIGDALRRGGNADVTIRLYPRGDHALFESARGWNSDVPKVRRFVPGYLEDLDRWIAEKVPARRGGKR